MESPGIGRGDLAYQVILIMRFVIRRSRSRYRSATLERDADSAPASSGWMPELPFCRVAPPRTSAVHELDFRVSRDRSETTGDTGSAHALGQWEGYRGVGQRALQ